MLVFWVRWFSPDAFRVWYSRRGVCSNITSDKWFSRTLYKHLLQATTARRGEPGSRQQIPWDVQRSWSKHRSSKSGHESCRAVGGTPTGLRLRSETARSKRKNQAKEHRKQSRQNYRKWKSQLGGHAVWAGQLCQSPPPFRPTHSAQYRNNKKDQASPYKGSRTEWFRTHVQAPKSTVRNPRPTATLKFSTWNVEGLYDLTKYDQIFQYMHRNGIDVVAIQETKATSTHSFQKEGYEIFLSGTPDAPHHGVGFIVHPSKRHLCSNFLGDSSRICSIEVAISPSPIMLVNCYAPSMVEDPEEDLERKTLFWDSLDTYYSELQSHKIWIFLGDWNSRLSPTQDLTAQHIGSDAWDKRQTLQDPERDNAEYFLSFLQSRNLYLPQTFSQPQGRKRITYHELTAGSNDYYCPQIEDWAALDYIAVPRGFKSQVHSCASNCQVSLATRHFPVELVVSAPNFKGKPWFKKPPTLDFTAGTGNYRKALDDHIHLKLSTVRAIPPTPTQTMAIFTDGSCSAGPTDSRKGGWGFAVSGPVPSHLDPMYCTNFIDFSWGPCDIPTDVSTVPTNNLAEIQAVIEALDWLIGYFANNVVHYYLFTDSDYVLGLLEGRNHPSTNFFQVALLLSYWQRAESLFTITVLKVVAHVGIPGNERADALAAKGQTSLGKSGRFSIRPAAPLISPQLQGAEMPPQWLSYTPDEKTNILQTIVNAAAQEGFPRRRPEIRKPYLSNTTFQLVEKLASLTQPSQAEQRRLLRNRVKKMAKRDKKIWWNLKFCQDHRSHPSQQWKSVQQVRAKFAPRPANIRDIRGVLRPSSSRPEVFAEYLQTEVWAPKNLPALGTQMPPQTLIPPTIGPIQFSELQQALALLKVGKSPGPDEVSAELLKYSSTQFQALLLSLFSDCFLGAMVPSSWKISYVVMLLKNASKPATALTNYRPISLTTSMYKLYAMVLRSRLQPYIDPHLRHTQFGFRPRRSVSQPIHILRQLMQTHERQTHPLHLIFLDWAKAFDSVTHDAIQHALIFHGVPEPLVQAVLSLYANPSYQVKESGGLSQPRSQMSGLRQGCPLSPYLFIAVTTTMFKYVEVEHIDRFGEIAAPLSKPEPIWDLQFADDTVLLANSAELACRLLHGVQRHGYLFGLELNPEKCEHLAFNSESRVYFRTGNPLCQCSCKYCKGQDDLGSLVPSVHEVKYLGVRLEDTGGASRFFTDRVTKANTVARLLAPFFRSRVVSESFRLRVYMSVVQSILLYSMESVVPTTSQNRRLDTVHFRVLRQIFNIKSPYYHRVLTFSEEPCSNQYLQNLANADGRRVLTPSQLAAERRLKLMGHILRHPDTPEHTVCFNSAHGYRLIGSKFRTGRPRPHWAELTLTESYRRIGILKEGGPPKVTELDSPFFAVPTTQEIEEYHGQSSWQWRNNVRLFRPVRQMSLNREKWLAVTGRHPANR